VAALMRALTRSTGVAPPRPRPHARARDCRESARAHRASSRVMASIVRLEPDVDPKYSSVVIHNKTAYFAGIAELGDGSTQSIEEQSRLCFAEADRVLKLAGCTKSSVLQVMVWLKDIAADYAGFNAEYVKWIDAANKPVRACVQSSMALPEYLVEIQITAAVP